MNYRIGWSTLGWTGDNALRQGYQNPDYPLQALSTEDLIEIWSDASRSYRPEVNRAQLNLLDSHDVPRALHSLNGDQKALKLALLLLYLQPGAPCVYYGTETGLAGGPSSPQSSGPEPACREAFPWKQTWNADFRFYLKELADLRRTYPVLRQGNLNWRGLGRDGLVAQAEGVEVWINRSRIHALALPKPQTTAKTLWRCDQDNASDCVPPQSAIMLATSC